MRIRRFIPAFSVLAIAGLFTGCKDPIPAVEPEPDTEVQSAIDAAWATYLVSDIEQMCAFAGVDQTLRHFYTPVPGTEGSLGPGTGTMAAVRDNNEERLSIVFNKTQCIDGRLRDGQVRLSFSPGLEINENHNANAIYLHRYGFGGVLTLANYKVDDWLIEMPQPGYLYNELTTNDWNPEVTNLEWYLVAKVNIIHPTDSMRNIVWSGKIRKVLLNTSDPLVFDNDETPAITWSLATAGYYGEATGTTNSVVPFQMDISQENMLIRDFTCSPDRLGGVTLDPDSEPVQREEEHHPFVRGIASFKTGEKYPRQIYFGNESNTDLQQQCDNTGEVMIKGIAYRVNFRK